MPDDRIDPLDHYMARIGAFGKRLSDFMSSNAATHIIGNPNMPAGTNAKLRAVLIPVVQRISDQMSDLIEFLYKAVEDSDKLPQTIDTYAAKVAPAVRPSESKPLDTVSSSPTGHRSRRGR